MSNRDIQIGRRFFQQTFYQIADLLEGTHAGESPELVTFKLYRDLPHIPLCQALPVRLGDVRRSFVITEQRESTATLDALLLATLLYYTYGFSRHDSEQGEGWPFHRLVPSARCLFPTELYLYLADSAIYPAGLYHYDPLHHRLALLRAGDYGRELAGCLGTRLDGTVGVLLLSAYFWKTAFRYRSYAYRLCTQEAGMVAGNGLMVAGTLGFQGHVHYHFLDRPLNRLLGLEAGEESVIAALSLYPSEAALHASLQSPREPADAADLLERIPPIRPAHIKRSTIDQDACALLLEIDRHSFLETTADMPTRASTPGADSCRDERPRYAAPPPAAEGAELAQALHRRSSGAVQFLPIAGPLGQDAFWEIIRYTLAPHASDLRPVIAHPWLQLFVVANHVEHLPRGIYRWCPQCGALHAIDRSDAALRVQAVAGSLSVNCSAAHFVAYILGDASAALDRLGNRAYRIMNAEAGVVAQRLCVMSAAYGLAARCLNTYAPDRCAELLQVDQRALLPLFQIIVGAERPGAGPHARYRLAIRF